MNTQPQDTSAEEPDGGNPHIRFRGGPGRGNQPGLLNRWTMAGADRLLRCEPACLVNSYVMTSNADIRGYAPRCRWPSRRPGRSNEEKHRRLSIGAAVVRLRCGKTTNQKEI